MDEGRPESGSKFPVVPIQVQYLRDFESFIEETLLEIDGYCVLKILIVMVKLHRY